MNRSLGPVWSSLLGVIFLVAAGLEIYHGHATIGRITHTTYYEKIDPGAFWSVVAFNIAVGIFLVGLGIYKFLNGDD